MSNITHDLQTLKEIHASDRLHQRIQTMMDSLSVSERMPIFPFFYTARIVLAVLLLFVFLGSGMVLAAYNSNSRSPLFPIKKAIVKAQLQFVKNPVARERLQQEIATPTPTPILPTPTEKPEPTKDLEGKPSIQVPHEDIKEIPQTNSENIIKKDEKQTTSNNVLGAQTVHKEKNGHNTSDIIAEPTLSLIPQDHED